MTGLAAAGLAGLTGAGVLGTRLWNRRTEQLVAQLAGPLPGAGHQVFTMEELTGLPVPVANYFRFALQPGQALIRRARLRETGGFRAGTSWSSFTAVHHVHTLPPGFVWDARIYMLPLLPVQIRDSYVAGSGAMQGRLAGLLPVVKESNRPDLDAGALLRYLAEAVWYPTALLPSQGVTWSALDNASALATLTDGHTTVSLQFYFGEQGEIVRCYTPARFRDVNGAGVPTPWGGTYHTYIQAAGMRVPQAGEVAWFLPEGPRAYWRGRLQCTFDFGLPPFKGV
ncbi:hypothetical protein PK28_00565 [Hymenobacter sp. DG25B]|nr:hypothetical protein PK28_00565 [Hymenobacter sp. DG25B]